MYCHGLYWLKLRPQKCSKKILFAKWAGKRIDFGTSSKKSLFAKNPNIGCFRKNYCGAVSHSMANFGSDGNSCTPIPPIWGGSFRVRFLCQKGCELWKWLESRVRLILLVSCPTPLGQISEILPTEWWNRRFLVWELSTYDNVRMRADQRTLVLKHRRIEADQKSGYFRYPDIKCPSPLGRKSRNL